MYNSKYTGKEVDEILAKAEELEVPTKTSQLVNDSGYATTEDIQAAIQESITDVIHSDL